MRRVLVYGSRKLNQRAAVFNFLDSLHRSDPIGLIITGACPNRRHPRWALSFQAGQARGTCMPGFRKRGSR